MTGRVLMIGLDSMSWPLIVSELAAGRLPRFRELRERAAFARLDSSGGVRTGLAWETYVAGHLVRSTTVRFDPETYTVWQEGTSCPPFFAAPDGPRTIALDVPQLSLAYPVNGLAVTGWGNSEPSFPRSSTPPGLLAEIDRRFGPHPAVQNDHEVVWHSPDRVERLGHALCVGATRRAEVMAWLQRRMPDWELGMTVFSEPHSASEAFWHGVAVDHPVRHAPSVGAAGTWMRSVVAAVDDAVGLLLSTVTEADHVVVASMAGMGTNGTDLPSMVLLPEVLHRAFLGRPFLRPVNRGPVDTVPLIGPDDTWEDILERHLPRRMLPRARAAARHRLPRRALEQIRRLRGIPGTEVAGASVDAGLFGKPVPAETQSWRGYDSPHRASLQWHMATRFRSRWQSMPAFAIPSFDDGAIRLNVVGRERNGIVPVSEYGSWCDRVEELLREVVDPVTGEPVVADVHRRGRLDQPDSMSPADLTVQWAGTVFAFSHPHTGVIGPFPPRRTGGHQDPLGFAFVAGPGIGAQDLGLRSASSLAATVSTLTGGGEHAVAGEPLVRPTVQSR